MARLSKTDLEQMGEAYFRSLPPELLVEVTKNLYELAVEQLERLEQTSKTSSRPPSSDNPYKKAEQQDSPALKTASPECEPHPPERVLEKEESESSVSDNAQASAESSPEQRKAGKQPGAPGKWRIQPLKSELTIAHYPQQCSACNAQLCDAHQDAKAYMGYHQLELKPHEQGFEIESHLHHYYGASCPCCGHHSQSRPSQGERFEVAGRKVQLQLQEYTLVGPMLASFIASLSVRYRLSRAKIQEFLHDWAGIDLAIGTLERSIREAGLACRPVVDELIEQLQQADILHLDETPWYEAGRLCWLWVAVSATSMVFLIGQRTKEMVLQFISTAFVGWLVSDGYAAYRWYEQRQRCLAHLIRKALALAQAVDPEARETAQWLLEEMRELMHALSTLGHDDPDDPGTQRLQKMAILAKASQHPQLRALAREILNDWDAVVAFVYNPDLPVTNNLAERALRHAVIARYITHGNRSKEGSVAYAALLSVIETCRLRLLNPWTFIADVIALRRKGINPPPMPLMA